MRVTAKKPDYGIDAPGVVRNLILFGVLCLIGFAVARLFGRPWQYSFLGPGISMFLAGLLMLAYSRRGKRLHRDRMLRIHSWRGDEQVLDVGTGRGLLLVGAAKRLTSGHATGIDIWKASDLSSNSPQSTAQNLAAEGVAHRCTLLSENTTKMSFADETFDVVLSNLCLHNIPGHAARRNAVREIVRVLKPGGKAILSDLGHTAQYARELRKAGLQVRRRWPNFLTTFPPLTIVVARKSRRT